MTTASDVSTRRSPVRRATGRRPPPPLPWVPQAVPIVAGCGLLVVVVLAFVDEPWSQFGVPGGPATFVGSLTGLVGTYLALLMLLMVSRIPPLERALGQDGVLRWHRRLAPWPITLITVHAVAIVLGYAQATRTGVWAEFAQMLSGYADVLAATVGLGLMLLAGITSIRFIRARMRRETWWVIHLYLYLALALSFAHALALGPSFVGHPLTRFLWSAVWVATAGTVIAFRFGRPLVRSFRHQLHIVEVKQEAPGVVSVICAGRHVERLPVAGGQFVLWRFLVRGMWWQAHPYSLSALPQPPYLRLTVKGLGDHSRAVARLKPGTRVIFEGPYGVFRREARSRRLVVLIAAGIGVTALRALLEDLPASSHPVVLLRASRPEELALRDEIASLAEDRQGQLIELIGSRRRHAIDHHNLRHLVPDISRRDAFVCGPEAFVAEATSVLSRLGLPPEAVHHEAFVL